MVREENWVAISDNLGKIKENEPVTGSSSIERLYAPDLSNTFVGIDYSDVYCSKCAPYGIVHPYQFHHPPSISMSCNEMTQLK